MYRSLVIGSAAALMVGNNLSKARLLPGKVPKKPLRSRI